jgi:TRAP-type C4-dicarboxylate transport system permease small subunit
MRLKDLASLVPALTHGNTAIPFYWLRLATALVVATLLIVAVCDMLVGVVLRYVVSQVTAYFDWPSVDFFWVEEVGEFALTWLTMLGGALGIMHGTHFSLAVVTHRLPPALGSLVARLRGLLMAAFGLVAAFYGWQVAQLNALSSSPGLSINLFWLYVSVVVAGALIVLFGLAAALQPDRVGEPDALHGTE